MQQMINHLLEFSLQSTNPILKNHASFSNIQIDDTASTRYTQGRHDRIVTGNTDH